jgi:hypothetical protein
VPARRAVNLAASVLLCSLLFAPRSRGSAEPASPPCPPSPAIAQLTWAPKETIRRFAPGSDNFPLTWADDDALYTTFGDGRGFQPLLPTKLSLGFARITGSPDNFTAANVRSPTGEQLGDGRRGPKGWGLLCVNGVLYLWTGHADRNGAQAQLAWSKDHAKTWTFADWKFPEFGLIGFVNHGRDNASAPDDFAYAYSHDHPRADTPADQFILMRVPDDRITDRTAYEFFTGLDAGGNPTWSPDGSRRRPVFEHEEACLRSAMTYNPGIKRYLWWQHVPRPPGPPTAATPASKAASASTTPQPRGAPGPPFTSPTCGTSAPANTATSPPSGSAPTASPSTSSSPATTNSPSARRSSRSRGNPESGITSTGGW